ncbi:MAG TPA: hypothetical protein VKE40_02265 [Gemmataceae bacterium]|nr:hypothetical protein [Gemmataceae bacterium]
MELTEEQRHNLRDGKWARWTDPETGQEYVLVPREQYEKLRAAIDGVTRRAGWDDPALDEYEQYRKRP